MAGADRHVGLLGERLQGLALMRLGLGAQDLRDKAQRIVPAVMPAAFALVRGGLALEVRRP